MAIVEFEFDGQIVLFTPPVSKIKVEYNSVSFIDANGENTKTFSSPSLARKFVLKLEGER